ncbi:MULTISPECIES: EF-hand domain-containing protein [Sphingomonas]|uniref:EF-hand domain-containing protein n=1 Tax=Sphingomonas TaxID=13687 RepID=UPI000DEFD87B|nr:MULTISPECIES: EF-hand domain-containing protein [Sphingomonas]
MMTLLLLAAATAAADAAPVNPNATELFDRDPALNAWALARFDANHDGWLTLFEAQAAVSDFKQLADTNHDGRVSVAEYEVAKRYLVARFNLAAAPAH